MLLELALESESDGRELAAGCRIVRGVSEDARSPEQCLQVGLVLLVLTQGGVERGIHGRRQPPQARLDALFLVGDMKRQGLGEVALHVEAGLDDLISRDSLSRPRSMGQRDEVSDPLVAVAEQVDEIARGAGSSTPGELRQHDGPRTSLGT